MLQVVSHQGQPHTALGLLSPCPVVAVDGKAKAGAAGGTTSKTTSAPQRWVGAEVKRSQVGSRLGAAMG